MIEDLGDQHTYDSSLLVDRKGDVENHELVVPALPVPCGNISRDVISRYFEQFKSVEPVLVNSQMAKIHEVRVLNSDQSATRVFEYLENIIVDIECEIDSSVTHPEFGVSFSNQNLQIVLQAHTKFDGFATVNHGERKTIRLTLPKVPLGPGTYFITVGIDGMYFGESLARQIDCYRIQVTGEFQGFAPVVVPGDWSVIDPQGS